ncbi:serine hydrolase [Amycolatopsis sp. A133]|uniref:serine hydrolase n=1 Tax=Amycolatopsis sp. A133 TaxID=3064472 RepID=UPI0027F31484|nr:serine hydrolase [Amycolatopsis sp. A133]MDQ7809603.1 serine hydrolase [Amycolatopsis sp. A133]
MTAKGSAPAGGEPFAAFGAWLAGHRGDVSVVAGDGAGLRLSHLPDVPRVLASTIKVVPLLAYTTAVAGGLDPDQPVRVGDWDAFHPFDGDGPLGAGAHHRALTSLGIACDEYGVARDPERLVPLDAIATAMISLSDNAAPDYLRARLGDEALRAAAADGGWPDADLRWFCGETLRSFFPGHPDLTARFTADPEFRREVLDRVRGEPISAEAEWAWTQGTARGTAAELFAFHRHLATADSPAAALARRKLGGDTLYKGGSLPRTRGFGLSTGGGTVAVLFTGTDFPEVPLPALGLAILSHLDAFARDLGVRTHP